MSQSATNGSVLGEFEGGSRHTRCGTNSGTDEIPDEKNENEKQILRSDDVNMDERKENRAPVSKKEASPTPITTTGHSNQTMKPLLKLPESEGGHSETVPSTNHSPLGLTIDLTNDHLDGSSAAKAISFKIKEEIYIVLPENQTSKRKALHSLTKISEPLSSRSVAAKCQGISESGTRASACLVTNSSRQLAIRSKSMRPVTFNDVASVTGMSARPIASPFQAYRTLNPAHSLFSEMPASAGFVGNNFSNGRHGAILPGSSAVAAPLSVIRASEKESTDSIISMRDGKVCLVKLSLALQVDKRFYVERYEENPKYTDLIITVVTASRHHPLFGCSQDVVDVAVTYDSKDHMTVIETPYIRSGVFQVLPLSDRVPHPIFADAFVQKTRFVSRSTMDTCSMPALSQYVILGDILQVPTSVRKSKDPMTNKLMKFLYSPKFKKFTLPILLGHGEPNVWAKMTRAPQVKPVFLKGKLNYERWNWVENLTTPERKEILRKCDPVDLTEIAKLPDDVPVCHFIYGNCVGGAVCPEIREILMRKHRAKCSKGCLDCLTPKDRKVKLSAKLDVRGNLGACGSHLRENLGENVEKKSKILIQRRPVSLEKPAERTNDVPSTTNTSCTTPEVTPIVTKTVQLKRESEIHVQRTNTSGTKPDIKIEPSASSTTQGVTFTVSEESRLEKGTESHSKGQNVSCSELAAVTESLESTSSAKPLDVASAVTKDFIPWGETEIPCERQKGLRITPFDTEESLTSSSHANSCEVDPTANEELNLERETKGPLTRRKAFCIKPSDTKEGLKSTSRASHHCVASTAPRASKPERKSKINVNKRKACCAKPADTSKVLTPACVPCTTVTEFNFYSRNEVKEIIAQSGRPKRSRKNRATCDCPDCKSRTNASSKKLRVSDKDDKRVRFNLSV